jgi:kumamolisin
MLLSPTAAAATSTGNVTLPQSALSLPSGAQFVSQVASNQKMPVSLVLQSGNSANLNSTLNALYTPGNPLYHQWLSKGDFNKQFAPSAAETAQAESFLKSAGFTITSSPSPFIVRATGTAAQINAAFHTQENNYVAKNGQKFFQNNSALQIPTSLSGIVTAVTGLTNTNQAKPNDIITSPSTKSSNNTTAQYGGAPDGSGLTPSQLAGIYGAKPIYALGNRGKGQGTTMAVFELSGYNQADITTYEKQFFGASENVPLVNINVDGGPINPDCPQGDICIAGPDYSGDAEVNADIETQIALAPKADRILVYNAPNDYEGVTIIDEYYQIANDDLADVVSSSWGLCESDAGFAFAQAESYAFMQMAAQGQSVFSATGDTGAFDCLRGSGTPAASVGDPSSQPYVTAVGGTSLESYDPGSNENPTYPTGAETVWNVNNLCSASDLTDCAYEGAGGGGVSTFWSMPSYQSGAGVINSYSQKGAYCGQAANVYCREIPDISADADYYTGYSIYCTGVAGTNSECAAYGFSWAKIGGTSLSTPLWSAIIDLWDSVHGQRFGEASFGLYHLYHNPASYLLDFHDITGKNQTENNNGLYPTTPNYDMGTGIGTPRITGIVLSRP